MQITSQNAASTVLPLKYLTYCFCRVSEPQWTWWLVTWVCYHLNWKWENLLLQVLTYMLMAAFYCGYVIFLLKQISHLFIYIFQYRKWWFEVAFLSILLWIKNSGRFLVEKISSHLFLKGCHKLLLCSWYLNNMGLNSLGPLKRSFIFSSIYYSTTPSMVERIQRNQGYGGPTINSMRVFNCAKLQHL